jgi:hypothetical protein
MPNWCENKLWLTHDSSALLDLAESAFRDGEPFQKMMPCPAELFDRSDAPESFYADPKRVQDKAQKEALNLEKHGSKDWYDWCVDNWGTKWDAADASVNDKDSNWLELHFNTAWGPPLGFYKHLEGLGFKVRGMYYEPGVGFAGLFENGEDKCWSDLNADDLDPHVREEMGIPWGDEDDEDEPA